MVRTFLTLDGDILEKTEWHIKPTDRCFYCNMILLVRTSYCLESLDGNHEWVTLTNP